MARPHRVSNCRHPSVGPRFTDEHPVADGVTALQSQEPVSSAIAQWDAPVSLAAGCREALPRLTLPKEGRRPSPVYPSKVPHAETAARDAFTPDFTTESSLSSR